VVGESEVTGGSLTPEQLAELEPYEDAIIGGETVETIAQTNLAVIRFIHSDPELAQKIANTLAEVFVNNNLERSTADLPRLKICSPEKSQTCRPKLNTIRKRGLTTRKRRTFPWSTTLRATSKPRAWQP